jgi:hypothetical protein
VFLKAGRNRRRIRVARPLSTPFQEGTWESIGLGIEGKLDTPFDWLIDSLQFYVPLKNFSLIWRRHHCRWRAAKFRPMLGAQIRSFEQGVIFIAPHLLWHGASVLPVSSEGPPILVASYDTQGGMDLMYSNPDPHGIYISRPIDWLFRIFRHTQ